MKVSIFLFILLYLSPTGAVIVVCASEMGNVIDKVIGLARIHVNTSYFSQTKKDCRNAVRFSFIDFNVNWILTATHINVTVVC